MQVVVVVLRFSDDRCWTVQPRVRTDIDRDRAGSNEAIDELLCEFMIDITYSQRRGFDVVQARVIKVDIETDLMRDVPEPAIFVAERTAFRQADVTDQHAGRVGMGGAELVNHTERRADQSVRPDASPTVAQRRLAARVPGRYSVPSAGSWTPLTRCPCSCVPTAAELLQAIAGLVTSGHAPDEISSANATATVVNMQWATPQSYG